MENRKAYCLQMMGITRWQLKKEREAHYLILVEEALDVEKDQLVARMLQAMEWVPEKVKIAKLQDEVHFSKLLCESKAKKMLMFCPQMAKKIDWEKMRYQQVSIAILPTLAEIMADINVKRDVWKVMQRLK